MAIENQNSIGISIEEKLSKTNKKLFEDAINDIKHNLDKSINYACGDRYSGSWMPITKLNLQMHDQETVDTINELLDIITNIIED